jgi:hypothetical protein
MKAKILWAGTFALALGVGLATQSFVSAQSPISAKTVMQDPLEITIA